MKEYKSLKNQEIQDISTEISLIKLASDKVLKDKAFISAKNTKN